MRLRLERTTLTDQSTIGKLFIDGQFECFTLEDKVRAVKIPGRTAIPAGTYEVRLTFSPRFQRVVPALENVPEFSGIRIHPGNTAGDTEGCILVGQQAGKDVISNSRAAYSQLFEKLQAGTEAGQVFIDIVNGAQAAAAPGAVSAASGDGISDAALAQECYVQSTRFEIVGSYIAAVAKYRSNVRNDRDGNEIGPFRLTEKEWDAYADDPELGEYVYADITNWRAQCAVFALMAERALDALESRLGTRPTPVQIYLAQIVGPTAAAEAINNPDKTIDAALANAPDSELPGLDTREQVMQRHAKVLTTGGVPATGEAAIRQITDALTPAFNVMDPLVVAASRAPSAPTRVRSQGDDLFRSKAPGIMAKLMQDFQLNKMQAAAILGNIGHECAGFKLLQEQKPRGGRGGWGWCQWTGPRRRDFEAWAAQQGLAPESDEANYGFLKHELETTQSGAIKALKAAPTLADAVRAFEMKFERAAADAKHYDRRERYARIAMEL